MDLSTGACPAHAPGGRQTMRERARKGGEATSKKLRRSGLSPSDLPPLRTHQDAQAWLETVGRAVLTGRITDPSPTDRTRSIDVNRVSRWLRKAEELAGLAPLPGTKWHAYRRLFASARRDLPVQDVARAGGWRSVQVVQSIYQQADKAGILAAVLHPAEVRETGL